MWAFRAEWTQNSFLLGTWIRDARRKAGEVGGDAANFVFNAKNQITLWGPHGEINDYSTRQWNGVMGDYHHHRWVEYLRRVVECVVANRTVELGAYHQDMMTYGMEWAQDVDRSYPEKARGDAERVGRRLQVRYLERWLPRFEYHSRMAPSDGTVYFQSVSRSIGRR